MHGDAWNLRTEAEPVWVSGSDQTGSCCWGCTFHRSRRLIRSRCCRPHIREVTSGLQQTEIPPDAKLHGNKQISTSDPSFLKLINSLMFLCWFSQNLSSTIYVCFPPDCCGNEVVLTNETTSWTTFTGCSFWAAAFVWRPNKTLDRVESKKEKEKKTFGYDSGETFITEMFKLKQTTIQSLIALVSRLSRCGDSSYETMLA